jgi:MoaA/NifB/PqqE/SkfB family radical SAM enzyme
MSSTVPSWVHWEMTYACPLRCVHCYTESGRRASRQLDFDAMMRIADIFIAMRPKGLRSVALSGGEPLLIEGLADLTDHLLRGDLSVWMNTSGYGLTRAVAERLAVLTSVRLSLDGATAATHDRIRGRKGSFTTAMDALAMFDAISRARQDRGEPPVQFGFDTVVTRSNFKELELLVTEVAPRFPMLRFVSLGAVLPAGLASRESYEQELLTDGELRTLVSPQLRARLKALAPPGVEIETTDNLSYALHPLRPRLPLLTVEPDGVVRGLISFQGAVGNLLVDPPEALWRAACELRKHPFVAERLAGLESSRDWARAARAIDQFFAAPADLVRISKRKPYEAVDPK